MHIIKQENGVVKFTSMKGKYTERTFSSNARIDYTNEGIFEVSDCGRVLTSFAFDEVDTIQVEPAAATTPANAAALLTELQTNFFFELTSADSVVVTVPNNPNDGNIYFDTAEGILKVWNGEFWQGANVLVEDFIFSGAGDTLGFLVAVANSGLGTTVITTPFVDSADLNTATTKTRAGLYQLTTSTTAGAFVALFNSAAINTPRYQLLLKGSFYISFTWSSPIIDFANDPVLCCAGLLNFNATTVVNPTIGIYFRMPRTGETSFVKYVIREGAAETVFDTAIVATAAGYVKTALLWDGLNDTMHFITGANDVYDTKSIANFSTTYPTAYAGLYHAAFYAARNGAGAVPASYTPRIDTFERFVFDNYKKYI